MEKEYAINEENGKRYEIKPDQYKLYPHLLELKKDCETVRFDSVKYWQMRCHYLEKTIDETYSVFERDNCREFYMILARRCR